MKTKKERKKRGRHMRKPPACEKKCESQFSELRNQYRENCTPSVEEHSCLLNLDRLCGKTGGGQNNRAKKKKLACFHTSLYECSDLKRAQALPIDVHPNSHL